MTKMTKMTTFGTNDKNDKNFWQNIREPQSLFRTFALVIREITSASEGRR